MEPSIGIVDLGASNITSVRFALERLGVRAQLVRDARSVLAMSALIVPGVANFGFVVDALDAADLRDTLLVAAKRGMPLLGICAGFQLLFEGSEEAPGRSGLGIFPGVVSRVRGPRKQHVGWNRVDATAGAPIESGWAYFTHGYAPPVASPAVCGVTSYEAPFASVAARDNVVGVQFHPERSGAYGRKVIECWLNA